LCVPVRVAKVSRHDRRHEAQVDVTALRALLAGVVDYAGLFPPAALDMPTALANYASYPASGATWVLGRFVASVARLDELSGALATLDSSGPAVHVAALLAGEPEVDVARVRDFNDRHAGRAVIDVLEAKVASVDDIDRLARATNGLPV